MQETISPMRESNKKEDSIITQQPYNSRFHADSHLKISVHDRGQATPKIKRDLKFHFSRVSEAGNRIAGCVTFSDGEDVRLLMKYLNDKFDSNGHWKQNQNV